MATIGYELGKPKADNTRRVYIILSHKGKRKRISTNIIIDKKSISKTGKITSTHIQRIIDNRLVEIRNKLCELELENIEGDIEWYYNKITKKNDNIDFFTFANEWLQKSTIKGKKNYLSMLNALRRYIGKDTLLFSAIDYGLLEGFCKSLGNHSRAKSLYLGEIRHLYNEAFRTYNTQNDKVIPTSPFEFYRIPKHIPQTNNRVISEESLVKIFKFQGTRRIGLARDCYILSFCLIGMNSIDLYECRDFKGTILSYNRMKTKDRRADSAHIEIEVPSIILPIFKKYKGDSRVFNFYTKYTNASNFNKHINKGLSIIAQRLAIPKFDFYSARHTWASIARNKLGIDKYTIHEALNHVSDLDVTDIYIQKDYTNINEANAKVIAYIQQLLRK
jgi:integrase